MKVAIIGASGKTGTHLVRESLERGYQMVAVCRDASVEKLDEFVDRDGFAVMTAPVISDEATLTQALAGCDAVVAILLSAARVALAVPDSQLLVTRVEASGTQQAVTRSAREACAQAGRDSCPQEKPRGTCRSSASRSRGASSA